MWWNLLACVGLLVACGDDGNKMVPDPFCGDGNVDPGEACDDGNPNPDDGCDACMVVPIPTPAWTATVIVRGATDPASVAMTPKDVAIGPNGDLYIADIYRNRVLRVDPTGTLVVVAGTGEATYTGDNGPARNATLRQPHGIAFATNGDLFIADTGNNCVRRVDRNGTIVTIAGTGIDGYSGDGGAANAAMLQVPNGVALAADNTLYIADTNNHVIRMVDPDGVISTIAGNGVDGYTGDGASATAAMLNSPQGVAVDAGGAVYIADTVNGVVRKVVAGTITTVAGNGTIGYGGDGGVATAANLTAPSKVAVVAGTLAIADAGGHRIRQVDASGTISTIAGNGTAGFVGDGGPATGALLSAPSSIAFDTAGTAYIADTENYRIRRFMPGASIASIAGSGQIDDIGDGAGASAAPLLFPRAVAVDAAGAIYISDSDHHRVRKVTADGLIATVAGTGALGFGGNGGAAVGAQLQSPTAVAFDVEGRMIIAEPDRVRRIDGNGNITTLAMGFGFASGLAVDAQDNIYVTDRDANQLKMIAPTTNTVTVVAGDGTGAFAGDNGPAAAAELKTPDGVAIHGTTIYIADTGNRRIRRIVAGTISTIAGNGNIIQGATTGDGGSALAAPMFPYGIAVDAAGNLYIADGLDYRVRKVSGGNISTIAGTGVQGSFGDGALATDAAIGTALDVAVDAAGTVYVVDYDAFRVRTIATDGKIGTLAGGVDPTGVGPLSRAGLVDARALVTLADRTLVANGTAGTVESVGAARVEVAIGRYQQDVPTGMLARYRDTRFGAVTGLAYDVANQRLYVSEASNNRIDLVTLVDPAKPETWTIAPFANDAGTTGMTDGPVHAAQFRSPSGLHLDTATNTLFVADTNNHTIRAIDLAQNMVRTIAGTAMAKGFAGDGGPALAAQLDTPRALAMCPNGDLFVADTNNNRVRRIASGTLTISTVAGTGTADTVGEGMPATAYPIAAPRGVACDQDGSLAVSSTTTVRRLQAVNGVVDGTGVAATIFGHFRDSFPASASTCLTGVSFTAPSVLRLLDSCAGTLVELRPAN